MENKLKEPVHVCYEKCHVTRALEVIGGKWIIFVMWKLSGVKSLRYNKLKRSISGITNIIETSTIFFSRHRDGKLCDEKTNILQSEFNNLS